MLEYDWFKWLAFFKTQFTKSLNGWWTGDRFQSRIWECWLFDFNQFWSIFECNWRKWPIKFKTILPYDLQCRRHPDLSRGCQWILSITDSTACPKTSSITDFSPLRIIFIPLLAEWNQSMINDADICLSWYVSAAIGLFKDVFLYSGCEIIVVPGKPDSLASWRRVVTDSRSFWSAFRIWCIRIRSKFRSFSVNIDCR
jgi:hypothetical protein